MISRRILRIKVLQVLYAFYSALDKDIKKSEKELFFSIQKTYDLYHYLLLLILDVVDYSAERIESAKQKLLPTQEELNPNTKFIDNTVVQQIRSNKDLNQYLSKNKLSWINYPELIKKIFNTLKDTKFFDNYLADKNKKYESEKEILIKIYSEVLPNIDDLFSILEEQSIYWNDEIDFVIGIVIRTLKKFKENSPQNNTLFPMYKNSDDIDFVKSLFRKAILNRDEYIELIERYTKNWEIDRIAMMDILILQMAITEVLELPTIPTKVTFNEYLEIAKFYSTKKSNLFINGVLDNIIKDLKNNNKIKKYGRGLVGES